VRLGIRPFRDGDAEALAQWLDPLAHADDVWTAASLIHQRRLAPRRLRTLWLVAVVDGVPVGLGRDQPQLFGGEPGLRGVWVGVRPEVRRRGIGTALWERIGTHAREVGARKLRSSATSDQTAGERFLLSRGFAVTRQELQSYVDPTTIDKELLRHRRSEAGKRGFRVAVLRELLPEMETALRKLSMAADGDSPGHDDQPPVSASTFHRVMIQNPTLDADRSTVVFHGDTPVALCWLKGDISVGRYGIEFTGTAPDWRGQGLATLAKLAALDLAARAGIRWVGTTNDRENAAMLAVNRRLGHRPLPDLNIYEREIGPGTS
jgi:GNAT superfamily N-acetyltransferase